MTTHAQVPIMSMKDISVWRGYMWADASVTWKRPFLSRTNIKKKGGKKPMYCSYVILTVHICFFHTIITKPCNVTNENLKVNVIFKFSVVYQSSWIFRPMWTSNKQQKEKDVCTQCHIEALCNRWLIKTYGGGRWGFSGWSPSSCKTPILTARWDLCRLGCI